MSKSKKVVQEKIESEECPNNSEEEIKVVKKSYKKSKEPKIAVEMYEPPKSKVKSSKKIVESDEKPKKVVKVNAWIDFCKEYNAKNSTKGFTDASKAWKKQKEDKLEKEAKKSKKSKK